MSLAEVQNTVCGLSESERGSLAVWLLDTMPPHSHEDASGEAIAEARRRREQMDSGAVRLLSEDQFWAVART